MIKAENIRKSYGTLEVLKGVSLEVKPSEVVSIVGQSGAGKTTLIKQLLDEGKTMEAVVSVFEGLSKKGGNCTQKHC